MEALRKGRRRVYLQRGGTGYLAPARTPQTNETVLKAYGWEDINLTHDFYEVDYLPKNDRVRYTISLDARKKVFKRLLKLHHEIHEQEVKAGLHVKGKTKKKQKAGATEQIKLF